MTTHPNNAKLAFLGCYLLGMGIASMTCWAILSVTTNSAAPWGYLVLPTFLHFCSFLTMVEAGLHLRAGILEPVLERWHRAVILGLAAHFGCLLVMASRIALSGQGSVLNMFTLIWLVVTPLVTPLLAFKVAHRVLV